MGAEAAVNEYIAHIESDFMGRTQRIYVWRRLYDGALEIVSMGDTLTSRRVVPEEGVHTEAKPFMEFATALYPDIDGILKALHDLYRRTHNLTDAQPALDVEPLLATMDSVIDVERARVDKMIDKLMERIR